ncbi:3-oxoacyl-ACP reductase FabG [Nicoliella spurrieriana]|uniref:3-oxoacyl-ACP reductase FabG n=1 Tax=Nicoliella spurrieriana TaxID=2925830 RepID=A0A976RT84_9LACO|nr:3-oxoacyl-ACP reductase FabG [Nicoliella spurrieriana]UQS87427.1 3-oxoacyl-ACP reductase FabG [Nicoliella spurrieriana]
MTDKRVILITGGTKGIGLATAQLLAKDSANLVVVNAHRALGAEKTAALKEQFANDIDVVIGDVAKEADAKRMLAEVIERHGTIDALVNNAGITQDKLLTRMGTDSFEEVLRTNLVGAFNMTKFAMKTMQKKRTGSIVNLSSIAGLHGNIGQANYSASKAGLVGLTKTTAQEGALRGIRCNAVAPGMVKSDMTDKLSDRNIEKWEQQIPLGRFGDPADIADAIQFLLNNSYITGQVITLDGGLTI